MSVKIEIVEMRRLHAHKIEFEHQESEIEYAELKKSIRKMKQKLTRKKRSGGR